jgi:hypothetical protein
MISLSVITQGKRAHNSVYTQRNRLSWVSRLYRLSDGCLAGTSRQTENRSGKSKIQKHFAESPFNQFYTPRSPFVGGKLCILNAMSKSDFLFIA